MRSNGRAFQSLQSERVATVAVLNYIGLVYALIFGVTIFAERYPAQTVLGIAMVVAGVLLSLPAAAGGPLRKTNSMPPTLSGSSKREGAFAGGGFPEKYFAFAPRSDLIGSKE